MAIRRSLALHIGGFREDLGLGKKTIPAEETDLFSRMRADGAKILYMPAPSVNHHLDMGRTNLKYWRRWHRGFGRASVLMKPPGSPLSWLLKFTEHLFNVAYFSLRILLPGGKRSFRAHRKQAQAAGRLAQMIGI